jgi:hypothetical protein
MDRLATVRRRLSAALLSANEGLVSAAVLTEGNRHGRDIPVVGRLAAGRVASGLRFLAGLESDTVLAGSGLRRPQLPHGQGHADSQYPAREHVARVVGPLAYQRPVDGKGRAGERDKRRRQLLSSAENESEVTGGVARWKRRGEGAKLVQGRSTRVPPADDGLDRQMCCSRRQVADPAPNRSPAALWAGRS